jgi:hypothetical protein
MQEFAVVDLVSQAEAVAHHTHGWSPEAIITWLRTYGQVTTLARADTPPAYLFESSVGVQAALWFTPDGHLVIAPRGH